MMTNESHSLGACVRLPRLNTSAGHGRDESPLQNAGPAVHAPVPVAAEHDEATQHSQPQWEPWPALQPQRAAWPRHTPASGLPGPGPRVQGLQALGCAALQEPDWAPAHHGMSCSEVISSREAAKWDLAGSLHTGDAAAQGCLSHRRQTQPTRAAPDVAFRRAMWPCTHRAQQP